MHSKGVFSPLVVRRECKSDQNSTLRSSASFASYAEIFVLDIAWVIAFGAPKSFGVGCTQVAHPEISAGFPQNRHFGAEMGNPQMCLVGAHTAPQNLAPKSILLYLQSHVKILGQKI